MSTACSVHRSASYGRQTQANHRSDAQHRQVVRRGRDAYLSEKNKSITCCIGCAEVTALIARLGVAARLRDARQPQAAVAVLRELLEQLLVLCLCCLQVAAGLLHARQVVAQRDLKPSQHTNTCQRLSSKGRKKRASKGMNSGQAGKPRWKVIHAAIKSFCADNAANSSLGEKKGPPSPVQAGSGCQGPHPQLCALPAPSDRTLPASCLLGGAVLPHC